MNIITLSPQQFRAHMKQRQGELLTSLRQTPAGILEVTATPLGIVKAVFGDQAAVAGEMINPSTLVVTGTPFQLQVWQQLLALAINEIVTYQDIARRMGRPTAHRAVANAVGANPIAYFIPCHQVIRADGSLGGYRWGIERKKKLLKALGAL